MIKVKLSPKRSPQRQRVRFSPIDFRATSCVMDLVLLNLNSRGMSIETRQSVRVGATYPFRIRRGQQSVAIDGMVLWCKLQRMVDVGGGESRSVYRAGVSFTRRLNDFEPLRSDERRTVEELELLPATSSFGRQRGKRPAVVCHVCLVPAVEGARRCQVCGTILRQV